MFALVFNSFNLDNFIHPLGAIPQHTGQFIERGNTKAQHTLNFIKYEYLYKVPISIHSVMDSSFRHIHRRTCKLNTQRFEPATFLL